MLKALYPGSFDPITNGHIDIIQRASTLCDEVLVTVLPNISKSPLFSLEERMEMIKTVTSEFSNVSVTTYSGLLVNFADEQNAQVIIKGLRAVSDFEYEFQQALINKKLYPEFETMFLSCNTHYMYLSSSMVKQIAAQGRDVEEFIPTIIYEDIMKRLYKPLAEG